MFKIQTVLKFSMKNQPFLSSKINKRNSEWTRFKVYFIVQISNQISNCLILTQLKYQKSNFFLSKKKQKKFKIQRLFHRKLTIRRLEPNLKPCRTRFKLRQTIFRFFSTFFFILQKKKQILKERFIQSLYFIKNVCPNIKFPFGQGKFYDYPTSANIQDLKRCPRPCERVRANW